MSKGPEEVEGEQGISEETSTEETIELDDVDDTPAVESGSVNPEFLNLQNEVKKWKTFARRHEQRAKENYDKLQEFEDAQKSDIEKLSERAAKAEQDRAEASLQVARMQIAIDYKLTMDEAKRLQGKTPEELEEDAEELIKLLQARESSNAKTSSEEEAAKGDEEAKAPVRKTIKKAAPTRKRPKERLRPGAVSPGSEADTRSGEEIASAVLKRARGY